jgi:hypothetical protein
LSGTVDLGDFNQLILGLAGRPNPAVSGEFYNALSNFVTAEGLTVDLSAVPEPSALTGLVTSALLLRRTRRRAARS